MDAYFDIVGGASGDMLLSSLVGLGCSLRYLRDNFMRLDLNFRLRKKKVEFGHFKMDKICFSYPAKTNLSYRQIIKLIHSSSLDKNVKEKVFTSFRCLFNVERIIHHTKQRDFKFDHLGQPDAILEILGFFLGLQCLNIDDFYVSTLPLSRPAPATLELLKGKKIKIVDFGYESITPTAALLLNRAEQKECIFSFKKYSLACGDYGDSDYLLAYLLTKDNFAKDKVVKIETTIDDMNPQVFEVLFDALYSKGAKEVYIEQVVTKKSRPAFVINVLSDEKGLMNIREEIFKLTSTFGLRYQVFWRDKLKDRFVYKRTPWGKIRFRVSLSTEFKKEIPEYEDCKRISKKFNIPLIEIYRNLAHYAKQ